MSNIKKFIVSSFLKRASDLLPTLTDEHLGQLLRGVALRPGYREQLALARAQLQRVSCSLSLSEQVEVAGYFLPVVLATQSIDPIGTDGPSQNMPPFLLLDTLTSRVRGQRDSGVLIVTGRAWGTIPTGARLLLTRDGESLGELVVNAAGRFRYEDLNPGNRYRVELTRTGLNREQVRPLVSPVLFGTLAHGATPAQLRLLPVSADVLSDGQGRFAFVGARNRMYLAVPVSQGSIIRYTQPNDQNADITTGFTHSLVTLDFGADGTDVYRVSENTVDFIGPLTFDAFTSATTPIILTLPSATPNAFSAVFSATF